MRLKNNLLVTVGAYDLRCDAVVCTEVDLDTWCKVHTAR